MTTIAKYIIAAVAVSFLIYGLSILQEIVPVKFDIGSLRRPIRRNWVDSYEDQDRNLQTTNDGDYYYTITEKSILGSTNPDVAAGNPLKGLVTSPAWTGPTTPAMLPTSLEFYYFGLDEIMIGNNKFDWSVLDKVLMEAAGRYKHVIWRVYCHYPGRPLAVPKHVIDQGLDIDSDGSPFYDDIALLTALEQFVKALGARYDGHKSLAFVQLGLLGYWGEWHTYPDDGLLSDDIKKKVYLWYSSAFKTTKIQARDPIDAPAGDIGFHDDSFAYSTIGPYSWYFWPKLVESGNTEAWTKNPIGGETSPNLQSIVFESWYTPGSDKNKQDFMECVRTTHATYMLHSNAFKDNGYTGTKLDNARFAHTRMGYNYIITKIGAISTSMTTISVDVTIMQIGVAPFYYPLSLVLSCSGTKKQVDGLETVLDDTNDMKNYRFDGIPIDANCLRSMKLQLVSSFTYEQRPIKFAQGNGNVLFSLPAPTTSNPTKLTLIDAASSTKIKEITNNMVIYLSDHKTINILAEPPPSFGAGSVEFSVDGTVIRVENLAPFLSGGSSDPWRPTVGSHTLKITPYKEKNLVGSALAPTIVTVIVVDQKPVPTKSPVSRSPVAPPTSSKLSPTRLTLIDAASSAKIREITNNMVINLADHKSINVLAEPPASFGAGSVEFSVDGRVIRVENLAPFVSGGSSDPWRPTVGSHILKITPYEEKNLMGNALAPTIVSIVVVDQKPVPTKSPVASSKLTLTLIDAHSNNELSQMTNGMRIDLLKYPLLNISVDIDASLSVDRVEFYYDGDLIRVEYNAPYSFYGNSDNDFFGWRPTVGDHFVEVRAFRDRSLAASVSITFYTAK